MGSFKTSQVVRFGHVDPAGIAYFPRLFDYIHEAFEILWSGHMGRSYYDLVGIDRMGFPLAKSEVEFTNPLRFGDEPEVTITCFKLGRASLGLRYVYSLGSTVCFEAKMTTVCVALDDLSSVPIPDAFRAKFEEILEPEA